MVNKNKKISNSEEKSTEIIGQQIHPRVAMRLDFPRHVRNSGDEICVSI